MIKKDGKRVIIDFYDDISNILYLINENISESAVIKKIEFYLQLLNSEEVDSTLKERIKKQFNKEIARMVLDDEDYDKWYIENIMEEE